MEYEIKLDLVSLDIPEGCNIIVGQSHFIKTVEDLYEVLASSTPTGKFGIAFCEASGKRLIRWDGNDEELTKVAIKNAEKIGAGHTFVILLKDMYPINVLNDIKDVEEVCRIYAATANPLQVIVAETDQGRGIIGVVDGFTPMGVEGDSEKDERIKFLRKLGYKR